MTSPISSLDSTRQHQAGFAHLAALLTALLLSTIAASFVVQSRTASLETRAHIDLAQAKLSADAGIYHAIALAAAAQRDGDKEMPTSLSLEHAGYDVRITLGDENQKLDINRANEKALQSLFVTRGQVSQAAAMTLAQAIVQYRERDGGDIDPMAAPADQMIRIIGMSRDVDNMAFDTLVELKTLPQMTNAIFDTIEPYITVYGDARQNDAGRQNERQKTILIEAFSSKPEAARLKRRAVVSFSRNTAAVYVIKSWD